MTAESLLSGQYTLRNAEPFDVQAFLGAMPNWVNTSFADARFNETTRAMEVDGLVLSLAEQPQLRVVIEKASLWAGDSEALNAVLSGIATDGARPIIDRVMLSGLRTEGLEWAGDEQSMSITMDKLVLDGLEASSFTLAPREQVAPLNDDAGAQGRSSGVPLLTAYATTDPAIEFARMLGGIASSVHYDGVAYSNLVMRSVEAGGSEVVVSIDSGFTSDYDRGRTLFDVTNGLRISTRTGSDVEPYAVRDAAQTADGPDQGNDEADEVGDPRRQDHPAMGTRRDGRTCGRTRLRLWLRPTGPEHG